MAISLRKESWHHKKKLIWRGALEVIYISSKFTMIPMVKTKHFAQALAQLDYKTFLRMQAPQPLWATGSNASQLSF